jgi:hypothetical protein
MKKLTTLILMVVVCGAAWGQWDVSNDGILYKKHNGDQIILKTTRTDNSQEGYLSTDGWGNFLFNRNLTLGGFTKHISDNSKIIIQTTRSDNTQQGALLTDGWGNFIFSKSLSINSNLYLGKGQLRGELNLRSGTYQRVVTLTANNSYTVNTRTFGLKINPNQIIDLKGHYITDTSKTFTLLSASRSDGTSFNELLQHKVYEGTNKHDLNFTNNGKVGIGTNAPSAKLDVAGNIKAHEIEVTLAAMQDLQLNGTLAANNITYTANGNTADFVFEDNYQLKDLSEVETFIKTNKHLPEIPSADEMEEAGVNLAEMNKLLLMKVEELTLYAIEQKAEAERLKAEMSEVRSNESEVRKEISSLELKVQKQEERLAKMEVLIEKLSNR